VGFLVLEGFSGDEIIYLIFLVCSELKKEAGLPSQATLFL